MRPYIIGRGMASTLYRRPSAMLLMYPSSFQPSSRLSSQSHSMLRMTSTNAQFINCDGPGIALAGETLRDGGLCAFPTETVYGLGANALSESSVLKIFEAKKRPLTDPLIVHVLHKEDMLKLFDFQASSSNLSSTSSSSQSTNQSSTSKAQLICELLCDKFWPGPLTIIYKANKNVPLKVTASTGFVGVRSPRHPIARALLKASGIPVAAPSANRFGHVSPTTSDHVMEDLANENVLILRDEVGSTGGCQVGIESTVCRVSLDGSKISILRCGAVTAVDITRALQSHGIDCVVSVENNQNKVKSIESNGGNNKDVMSIDKNNGNNVGNIDGVAVDVEGEGEVEVEGEGAVSPGQMIKHYAPDVPTFILLSKTSISPTTSASTSASEVQKNAVILPHTMSLHEAFVIDFGGQLSDLRSKCASYTDLSSKRDVAEACTFLFTALRESESQAARRRGVKYVLLPDLTSLSRDDGLAAALWERMHRAASGQYRTLN